MNTDPSANLQRDESPSAATSPLGDNSSMFQILFERSSDAILLYDPKKRVFVDCNQAAVDLMRAGSKGKLLQVGPEDLSPTLQPGGMPSREMTAEVVALVEKHGTHRFEWIGRRFDGHEIPLEVVVTSVQVDGRGLNVSVVRDISERKKTERELLELNQSLERRVAERTAALTTSEARFRALVEHAPEAIVVFDGDTGRFLFGNEHACIIYGVPMEKLTNLTPADVSPEFQPDGRRSSELARELMDEALSGGTPVFEWTHRQPGGRLIPTEVRLLRLPAEGQNLVRASIIDNTERKRAERALRDSEEKFRALFEGSSQGVILQDEHRFLEVNPAAVRIMGCQSPQELLGKLPMDSSPPFQPNGESSEVLARKYIHECMTRGSARFEWMIRTPQGRDVPIEVTLTRIEWSGRQVIQALLNDIRERKQAEGELRASAARLRESEARFSAAFQASPVSTAIGRVSDQKFVLVNDAFVRWTGYSREEILGRTTDELDLWEDPKDREEVWAELRRFGTVRERECRFHDRAGRSSTILLSAEVIDLDGIPHTLTMGVDITERKRTEAELRAGEARLRESEARFSTAFHASPIITAIFRASNARFVLVNDAFLNWECCSREEVLGRTTIELGMWENPAERTRFWAEVLASGSVREQECRVLNRHRKVSTMLVSGVIIEINGEDHLLAMMVDISQRKQAEVELYRTLARETELSQLKSNFVSMVSHEFRTPLGIIQSSAELLRDFYQKMQPAERTEQLESISRNTRRMAGMMEEILILSRLDAGKLEFRPAALNLNSFLRRLVDEVHSATGRQCLVELSLSEALSGAKADERLLGHIFTNLLSNAVKYSEPGSTVDFAVERDGTDAVCVVRDQGIGISQEDQRHLFNAFHRGGNVGQRPGTGLGLLVVKRCVELHQGRVKLASKVGAGTTVTVRLPLFGEKL